MNTPLIWFSRHGETDWNVEGRVQGQFDRDINSHGQAQADANGQKLRDLIAKPAQFDFVASPLKRTRVTMERIRTGMGLPRHDYRLDDRLKEVHFGDWQGYTLPELEIHSAELIAERERDKWNFLPPGDGAESYEMLARRFECWLKTVTVPTVCVTHGGIIRSLFYLVGGMGGEEAARMPVPQDKVMRMEKRKLVWF